VTPPLVSILTPSFNQAQWLKDNIRSVQAQTYGRIEHLICDGGSTDATVEILDATEPPLRWWSEPDRGQSHALNKAFERSGGDIIGWINSDDAYFSKDVVEDIVRTFERSPEVDVVYGHAALVNEAGLILRVLWAPRFKPKLLRYYNYILQPSVFIRRSAIHPPLVREDFQFSMDRDLWHRLAKNRRFRRINKILSIDRHQRDRKTYQRSDLRDADRARLAAENVVEVGASSEVVRHAFRIVMRAGGMRHVVGIPRQELACEARFDGMRSTLARQLVLRRTQAPMDSPLR
jgi:glycosyltransferase involved in cell wall biosynthesis